MFLCTLDTAPRSAIETGLRISVIDYTRFNVLMKQISKISVVIKELASRRKNGDLGDPERNLEKKDSDLCFRRLFEGAEFLDAMKISRKR